MYCVNNTVKLTKQRDEDKTYTGFFGLVKVMQIYRVLGSFLSNNCSLELTLSVNLYNKSFSSFS